MKVQYKILAWIGMLMFVGLITIYTFEFHWIENTFESGKLVVRSIIAGVVIGILLGIVLRKQADDLVSRLRLWSACLILPAIFAPLAGSLSNRLLTPHAESPVYVEFWEEKPYAQERFGFIKGEKIEPEGFYIFLVREGEMKRFKSETRRFPGAQRGQQVEIPVKKGLWGFDVLMWK